MKLATLNNGTRDGQLVVASRDLTLCVAVPEIARTLQQALDNWDAVVASLQDVYFALNERTITARLFDPEQCLSPLPRAYHWRMVPLTLTMLNWCAKRVAQKCPPVSGRIL